MARKRRGAAFRAAKEGAKLGAAAAATASAAGRTVAHRSLILTQAAGAPNATAAAEIVRMTAEKFAAAALAGAAAAAHAPGLWRLWLGAATAPWAFAAASARAASATLAPYRRTTRANAKRLSAKRRMS